MSNDFVCYFLFFRDLLLIMKTTKAATAIAIAAIIPIGMV